MPARPASDVSNDGAWCSTGMWCFAGIIRIMHILMDEELSDSLKLQAIKDVVWEIHCQVTGDDGGEPQ